MQFGKLYPQTSIDYDTLEKIFEHTVTTADSNAKLLAMFDGTDGATTGTAETGQTITFAGTAQLDTAQKKLGTASLLLDGNSDYVTVPDSADWDMALGSFTWDCWVKLNSTTGGQTFMGQYEDASNYVLLGKDLDGKLIFESMVSGSARGRFITTNNVLTDTSWHHIAFVISRTDDVPHIYLDGVDQAGTETADFNLTIAGVTAAFAIGSLTGGGNYTNGWIDAVRITKGEALWTSDFTPPTTPSDYASATSINIFGLSGNTDEMYVLDCRFVGGYAGVHNYQVYLNGDATSSNYGFQQLYGTNTTIGASRETFAGLFLGSNNNTDYICHSRVLLYGKSGYNRTSLNDSLRSANGTTIDLHSLLGESWANTSDEITSIIVLSNQTGGIGVGSRISLYRRISAKKK